MANLSPMQPQLSDLFTLRGGTPNSMLSSLMQSRPTMSAGQGASSPNRILGLQNAVPNTGLTGQVPPGAYIPPTPNIPQPNLTTDVVAGGPGGGGTGLVQNILSGLGPGGGFTGQQGVSSSMFGNVLDQLMTGQLSPAYNPYAVNPLANQVSQPREPSRRSPSGMDLDAILNTTQPVSNTQPVASASSIQGLQGLQNFARTNPQIANGIFGEGGLASLLQRFQSMFTPFEVGNTNSGVLGVLRGLRGGITR